MYVCFRGGGGDISPTIRTVSPLASQLEPPLHTAESHTTAVPAVVIVGYCRDGYQQQVAPENWGAGLGKDRQSGEWCERAKFRILLKTYIQQYTTTTKMLPISVVPCSIEGKNKDAEIRCTAVYQTSYHMIHI